jgi:hypothetical protein
LISKNGVVQTASWNMIDSETLKISVEEDTFLLVYGFLDKEIRLAIKI